MKILLDPGHGINTPGKRSPDGTFREYLFNREVADIVMQKLTEIGVEAYIVVTETNDIPLRTRAMRVNKYCDIFGKENVVLLSIHSNAAGDGGRWMNATGWECYTSPGRTGSDELAECMYGAFEAAFPDKKMRRDLSDGDSDKEASFYILTKTRCHAVLLENFFYDNREECRWLQRQDTKERIADAVVSGVLKFIWK